MVDDTTLDDLVTQCADYLHSILEYCPTTGILRWRKHRKNNVHAGDIAGWTDARGRRRITIDYHIYIESHIIWVLQKGCWPDGLVDHKDGNPSNQVWTNLRIASYAQNAWNRELKCRSASGYRGVSRMKSGRYEAHIKVNHQIIRLGVYMTAPEAYVAWCAASKKYHTIWRRTEARLRPRILQQRQLATG